MTKTRFEALIAQVDNLRRDGELIAQQVPNALVRQLLVQLLGRLTDLLTEIVSELD